MLRNMPHEWFRESTKRTVEMGMRTPLSYWPEAHQDAQGAPEHMPDSVLSGM